MERMGCDWRKLVLGIMQSKVLGGIIIILAVLVLIYSLIWLPLNGYQQWSKAIYYDNLILVPVDQQGEFEFSTSLIPIHERGRTVTVELIDVEGAVVASAPATVVGIQNYTIVGKERYPAGVSWRAQGTIDLGTRDPNKLNKYILSVCTPQEECASSPIK